MQYATGLTLSSYAAVTTWEPGNAFFHGAKGAVTGAARMERTNVFVSVHAPVVFPDGCKALHQLVFTQLDLTTDRRHDHSTRQVWSRACEVPYKPGPSVSSRQVNMLSASGVLLIQLQPGRVAVLHFPDTPDFAAQHSGSGTFPRNI